MSKHKHAFTSLTLQSSQMELVNGNGVQRSFHLHHTAGSAGSADWANIRSTAASWRSSPPVIWYLYRSFTVQGPFPPSNTQQPMCGYTHNAHTELKQSNYISTAKHIIVLFNTNKWLVCTNSDRSLTALGSWYTERAFLLLLVGILESEKLMKEVNR